MQMSIGPWEVAGGFGENPNQAKLHSESEIALLSLFAFKLEFQNYF